jgi:hypothetical protein
MLRFFTILMLLCFASNTNAQTYVPFPTSADTAVWLQRLGNINVNMGASFGSELITKGDTVFDGKVYTKIYEQYANPQIPSYYASIREENKVIYLRDLTGYNINTDTVLYDFNIQIGDTIDWFGTEDAFQKPTILSTDSVLIDGVFRKRYEVSSNFDLLFIIEGIGSNNGLFPLYIEFESYQNLVCFSLNGNTIWYENANNGCVVSTKQIQQTDNISINPNPTSNFLNIDFETNEQRELQVFNQLGQLVLSEISNDANLILSLEYLPKGFYVLAIQTEKGTFTKKVIKK